MTVKDMLGLKEVKELASKYEDLIYLSDHNDIQANTFLYFLLGQLYLQR
jgi:hypothetical protein|tara:strand:+ start:257 stop:403 length:147 start_codon:yes stop_codon:yes gene_type:complete